MPPRYGRLQIGVEADLRPLESQIRSAALSAGQDASRQLSGAMNAGLRGAGTLARAVGKSVATGLGVATAAAAGFGVASFRTAARVGEMDATLRALASANRLSYPQMQNTVQAIRHQGIEAGVAQNLVAQFARNQLDLSKSTDLARVAQDAAVISGQNSSDTLDQLTHGIMTQNSLVLRNAGVNVQAGQAMDAYARQLGKTRAELTPSERAQAVLNAVLASGKTIAGAYSAAMEEPGKVLRSYPRVIDDVKLALGRGLVAAMKDSIIGGYEFIKVLGKQMDAGGALAPVVRAIGEAFAAVVAPLSQVIAKATAWLKALRPGDVAGIAEKVRTLGPAAGLAAAGLAAMVAPSVLQGIPGIGGMVGNLLGPLQVVKGGALELGKAMIGLTPAAGSLAEGLGGLAGPIGWVVAGFGLLMAVSPEFRAAVMSVVAALGTALRPALNVIVAAFRTLVPPLAAIVAAIGLALVPVVQALVPVIQVLGAALQGTLLLALYAVLPIVRAIANVLTFLGPALGPLTVAVLAGAAAWKLYQGAMALIDFARMIPFLVRYIAQINAVAIWQGIVAAATKVWAVAQGILNAVMSANPIGLVVVAIAALAAGMVIAYQRSAAFRAIVSAAFGAVRAVFMAVVSAAVTLWRWITGGSPGLIPAFRLLAAVVAAAAGLIRSIAVAAFNAVRAAAQWLWTAMTAGARAVLGFIRANWPLLVAIMGGPLAAAAVLVTRHWARIRGAITAAWNAVRAVTSATLSWLRGTTAALWGWLRSATSGAWNAVRAAITGTWTAVRGFLAAGWAWFRAALGGLWSWVRSATAALWAWFRAATSGAWNAVRSTIARIWAGIRGMLAGAWSWFRASVSGLWAWFRAATTGAWTAVRGIIARIWNATRGFLAGQWAWFRAALSGLWSWFRSATTGAWNAVRAIITRIWTGIRAFLAGQWAWFRAALAGTWNAARTNTAQAWGQIGAVIRGAWDNIRRISATSWTWLQVQLGRAWDNIRTGSARAWAGVVTAIGGAFARVRNVVAAPIRWVRDNIINKLIGGVNVLITKVGIKAIPPIPAFAEGGRVPGGWGGGDRIPILAEPGEWMLTKRQARAIGYGRLARLPRYQEGGLIGDEGGAPAPRFPGLGALKTIGGAFAKITHLDDLAKAGRELFDEFSGMLSFAAATAFKVLTTPIRRLAQPLAGDPQVFPRRWLGKLVILAIDRAIAFIESKSMGECDAGGIVAHAMKFDGKPYRWGGPANPAQGFDCSSFVSFIAGSAGLPLPGGFRVPSSTHGPITTDYLSFSGMNTIPLGSAKPGDVAVNVRHIGFIIGPNGAGFAARSTATGIGRQSFASGYTYRTWKGGAGGAAVPCNPGGGIGSPPAGMPTGVRHYAPLVRQIAARLGVPQWTNVFLSQMQSESGGNPRAINNWDSNARAGTPSKGLMQVIDPTFAAYAGPMLSRGIWDPAANIYAAINYAVRRYGNRIPQVLGQGHGYARGGIIREHVVGIGQVSGDIYQIAEGNRPELVTPLTRAAPGERQAIAQVEAAAGSPRGGPVINVYPRANQSERGIAAAVSREFAWAAQGGGG